MLISNNLYNFYARYGRYLIIALLSIGLSIAGYFGYSWYKQNEQYRAQRDFAETGEDYYKIFSSTKAASWSDVEQGISFRAQQHRNTIFYPYFLAYKADALIAQNKNQEALSVLDNVLNNLDKSSLFYYLYAIKRALLALDFNDEDIRKQGLNDLENLANDKNNPYQDMASYYRGYYAFNLGDKVRAKEFWNKTISLGNKQDNQAVWVQLAQVRLQGLS